MNRQGWRVASFFNPSENNRVHCTLCPHGCVIPDTKAGDCLIRCNDNGVLYTTVWGRPGEISVGPIEERLLFHYLPGSRVFSMGTPGCNMDCSFCPCHELARSEAPDMVQLEMGPDRIVDAAQSNRCRAIAFAFNEPVVYAEYLMEISAAASRADIRSVAVTNGFITRSAIRDVFRHVSAAIVEIKAFDPTFYREQCRATLTDVLHATVEMAELDIHIELATTIIPGLNDSDRAMRTQASWIRDSLGMDTPLHLKVFKPVYRLANVRETQLNTLERLAEVARAENLRYVYVDGVKSAWNNSRCHRCGSPLIERDGHEISSIRFEADCLCPGCGTALPFVLD